MHLGELIYNYRKQNKMSMANFAEKAKMSKAYVSVLEKNEDPRTGKEIVPSIPMIKNVAQAMNISFEQLFNQIGDNELVSIEDNTSTLSLITSTSEQLEEPRQEKVLTYAQEQLDEQNGKVIYLNEIQEERAPYELLTEIDLYGLVSAGTGTEVYDESIERVAVHGYVPKHDIALRVTGESMEPLFRDDEIIFVKKTPEVLNGQIGIFIINGQAYVKKLRYEGNNLRLASLNKKYDDIIIGEYDDVITVGVVVM